MDAPWAVESITFDSTAGAFTITGLPLTIGSPGIVNNSANVQTFYPQINLAGPGQWNAAVGPIGFLGAINNVGNNLTITGGNNIYINSTVTGGGGLIKNGAGTLVLGGGAGDTLANTSTGVSTVNAGTVLLNKAAGVVAMAGDLIANGGTVTANRGGQFSNSSNVTLSGGLVNFGDSNTIGSLTALSGGYYAAADTLNLTSSAPFALTLASGIGLSHFNLTGASGGGINLPNGGSGSTTVGNIGLGAAIRNVNVADGSVGDDLVIAGVISGPGALFKTGPGTLVLSGNNTYTSGTTLSGGTLRVNSGSSLGTSRLLGLAGGATLQLNFPYGAIDEVVIGGGGGTFDIGSSGELLLGASTGAENTFYGSGPINKTGDGILRIGNGGSGVNTYTGTITASAGTLVLNQAQAVAQSAIFVENSASLHLVGSSAATSVVLFNSTGTFSTNPGTATVDVFYLLSNIPTSGTSLRLNYFVIAPGLNSDIDLTISGGIGTSTGGPPATMSGPLKLEGLVEVNIGSFGLFTISGAISGAGGLLTISTGTVVLSGANTYSGETYVPNGAVRIFADNGLGSPGTPLHLSDGFTEGILRTSSSFTLTHPISAYYGRIITDLGTTLTMGAPISGNMITKSGAGTLVLSVANSYGGGTIINGGTVRISTDDALGAADSPLTLTGGTLQTSSSFALTHPISSNNGGVSVDAGTTLTVVAPLQGGAFSKSGGGTLVLSANTLNNSLSIDEGTLVLAGRTTPHLNSLDIAGRTDDWVGVLDLMDNSLVIEGGDLLVITNQIRSGLNSGSGIISSAHGSPYRLGSMSNDNGGFGAIYRSFRGIDGLDGDEVLVRYTVIGDLNLDGTVSISDFIDLAAHFNAARDVTWQMGDVNYDGSVTIADFIDLASNFGQSVSGIATPISEEDRLVLSAFAASAEASAVPEAGSVLMCLLAVGGAGMRRRKMRRRKGNSRD